MSFAGPHGANYQRVDSTQQFAQLDTYEEKRLGSFTYVKAASAIAQYDLVVINPDGTAASATTALTGASGTPTQEVALGIAQTAIPSGSWGWVFRKGGGTGLGIQVNTTATTTQYSFVYSTTTAGQVSNTSTSSNKIVGLQPTVAHTGAGSVEVYATDFLQII